MMDPYTDPDSQSAVTQQAMATRLEERGQHPVFRQMIADYVETLPREVVMRALDLGCGTGVVARQLRGHLHASSEVRGADVSDVLLEQARRLDETGSISWDHIPPGPLPYEDASFNVITMHTLLSHVPDPQALLAEAKRVLKPGGRLIAFDADHAGTTYGLSDREAMRRINHLLSDAIASQPDVCRQMPRYLRNSGFTLDRHTSRVLSECGKGDYWLSSVRGFEKMLPALKVLSDEEAAWWVGEMLSSHDNGNFFASGVFFTFHASAG